METNYFFDIEAVSYDSMNYFHESIGEKINIDGVNFLYTSSVPAPQFNFFYIRSVKNIDIGKSLKSAEKFFKEKKIKYNVIFSETLLKSETKMSSLFDRFFYENSFSTIEGGICMYLDLNKKIFKPCEQTIRDTNSKLNEWIMPLIEAFECTEEISKAYAKVHKKALVCGKRFYHYTLYIEDIPVTSITISIYKNIARVDDLGTQPSQQKKGFGSALLNFALHEAQALGAEHCFVCASSDGLHMYKKVGFIELYEIKAYEKQKVSFWLFLLKNLGF